MVSRRESIPGERDDMIRRTIGAFLAATALGAALGTTQAAHAQASTKPVWAHSAVAGWTGATIALSPSGGLLAHHSNGHLRIFRTTNGTLVDSIRFEVSMQAMAWSPDSADLYLGASREVKRYRVADGSYTLMHRSTDLEFVRALAVSPDGTKVAAVGALSGALRYFIIPTNMGALSGPYVMPTLEVNRAQWIDNTKFAVNGPNVFNTTGTRLIANLSNPRPFAVSPDGAQIAHVEAGKVTARNTSAGTLLWSGTLPSTTLTQSIDYVAGGTGIAMVDSDAQQKAAVQIFTPNAFFARKGRYASALSTPGALLALVPGGRRLVLAFQNRANARGVIEQADVSQDLNSFITISTFSPRIFGLRALMPTVVSAGTGSARPGFAYHEFNEGRPQTTVFDAATGLEAQSFRRGSGNDGTSTVISRDGRWILYNGERETGGAGYHLYRTSDNTRVSSFVTTFLRDWSDVANTGSFSVTVGTMTRFYSYNPSSSVITHTFSLPTNWKKHDLSDDGTRLANVDSSSSSLWIVDTSNGQAVCKFTSSQTSMISSFQLASPTRLFTLESASGQLTGTLWNVAGANPVSTARVQVPRINSTGEVRGTLSPDLKYMALSQTWWPTTTTDRTERLMSRIAIVSTESQSVVDTWENPVTSTGYFDLAFMNESKRLVTIDGVGGISGYEFSSPLSSLTITPAAKVGGLSVEGTVTLASAWPTSVVVRLSSSIDRAVPPATVTVPANTLSAKFPIETLGVDASVVARITATVGGTSRTADLRIDPPFRMGVSIPEFVLPSTIVDGAVGIEGKAGPSGIRVSVECTDSRFGVVAPSIVTIPSGASSAPFKLTVAVNPPITAAAVRATSTSPAMTAMAPVRLEVGELKLLIPEFTQGGNAVRLTVMLPQAAPGGGTTVFLSSTDSTLLQLPTQLFIPAGVKTMGVTGQTFPTLVNKRVSGRVRLGTVTVDSSQAMEVRAPKVNSVLCAQEVAAGGTTVTFAVTLSGAAPANFKVIPLSSNNALATVPAQVTFQPGTITSTFAVSLASVTENKNVTISVGGKEVSLLIIPPM